MTHFLRRRGSGGDGDGDGDDARRVRRDVIMFSIELAFVFIPKEPFLFN